MSAANPRTIGAGRIEVVLRGKSRLFGAAFRMSSPDGLIDLPRRHLLSAQTAEALRKAIAGHHWPEHLPSERRLCKLLQVSRPTIRTALRQLAREGVIEIQQGRRIRLLARPKLAPAPQSRLVVLVSHEPLTHMTLTAYQGFSEMRTQLAEHGFTTEVLVCPGRTAPAQRRKLESFVRQNRIFCCVLLSVSRDFQAWIADHAIPALVVGSCHAGITLPSLDVDYRAVCRHAAGVFRAKGHRRLAFLVPDSGVAGDLVSEEGFREGAAARPGLADVEAVIVRHDGTAPHLATRIEALFASPRPPTALLVAKPVHTLSVLVQLLRRGLSVPDHVSLIARDHDHLYEHELAHYAFGGDTFAHRLSRLMLQMVGQGRLPAAPSLIFPRFVARDSVRSLPR